MESFFLTSKLERLKQRRYTTRDEARAGLFDYIERLYNPRRKHSTLGNISPVEFEPQFGSFWKLNASVRRNGGSPVLLSQPPLGFLAAVLDALVRVVQQYLRPAPPPHCHHHRTSHDS